MDLKELCESISIVDYMSQFLDLEKKGDEYWCLSPFKDEKTPSFSVREESGAWYDYSSGLGGNLYTFVKAYHKCSSTEAVERIKKYAGISGNLAAARQSTRMAATSIAKKFAPVKRNKKEAKSSVLPDDYMDRFEWNESKLSSWIDEGISVESLKKFGVRYDSFQNRIVHPVRSEYGKIINICGRTLDEDWKSKGMPKYIYRFPLGRLDTIGGLYENREAILKSGEIIVFEGIKSVMKADTWGIRNTACIFTSHLNQYQLEILAKLGVRVVLALDKGVDIRSDINICRLKRFVRVEYMRDTGNLIEEKDSPADNGVDTFLKLYNERVVFR